MRRSHESYYKTDFTQYLKKYISEATRRAVKHAENEDCVGVDLEHVERILPQLVSIFQIKINPNVKGLITINYGSA